MTNFMQGRDHKHGRRDQRKLVQVTMSSGNTLGSEPSDPPEKSSETRGNDQEFAYAVDDIACPIAWNA